VGGAAVAFLWAGLTTLAVRAAPERRATASSLFNAWKFVGYAVAPRLYAPLYTTHGATVAFSAAAALTVLILPLLLAATAAGRAGRATHPATSVAVPARLPSR
jgi:hypothetical protein